MNISAVKIKNIPRCIHDRLLFMSDKVPIITSRSCIFSSEVVMGASIVIQYFNNDILCMLTVISYKTAMRDIVYIILLKHYFLIRE